MILLDYSAVAIANMMVAIKRDGEQLTSFFALHMIMNSIRRINKTLSLEYGNMILCCDDRSTWRNEEFAYYKWKRKQTRKTSDIDWNLIYECLDYAKEQIHDGFPYKVITAHNAEADDIIGVLANKASDEHINTVIVSGDKDFIQLHSDYVCQYKPMTNTFIRESNPDIALMELVLCGDISDGIPNIKMPDDHFTVDGGRQKPMYKKEVNAWKQDPSLIPEEFKKNYSRNCRLIDLSYTPEEIKADVMQQAETGTQRMNKSIMTKFFMKHKLRYLHERINDFI